MTHFLVPFGQPFAVKRVLFSVDSVCGQKTLNILGVVGGKLALDNF
ncbi:hypothetical protein MCEMSEM18_03672 [Comamonadaceae bacterium]